MSKSISMLNGQLSRLTSISVTIKLLLMKRIYDSWTVVLFGGGTGNLPVPLGYQPSEMEESIRLPARARLPEVRPARSGRLVANRHRQVACANHSELRHYRNLGCDLKCWSNWLGLAGFRNLEEVLSQSPGLPVGRLPWVKVFPRGFQPRRGCVSDPQRGPQSNNGHNLFEVEMGTGVDPKIGPPGLERANLGLCATTSSRLRRKVGRDKTERHFKSYRATWHGLTAAGQHLSWRATERG